jgi:predicted nucleic acid-binding protein
VEILIMLERLLDSVILIDHFNDIAEASTFIAGLDPNKTAISVITYAEILVGFEEKIAEEAKALLNHYEILSIDMVIAEKAAELRRRYGWKLPDAFQAALAIHHRLRFCTRNTKDFNPKNHFFVDVPYKLKSP